MTRRAVLAAVLICSAVRPGLAAPPAKDDARIRQALEEMFRHGLQPGPQSLARAKPGYEAARRHSKADRRVEYAWGLVLQKGLKYEEALKQFTSICGEGDEAWIPAWQAQIVTLYSLRKQNEAFERLAGLALIVISRQASGEPAPGDLAAAQWIGRFLMAAELTSTRDSTRKLATEYDERISPVMDGDLLDWFESGRESVEQEFAILSGKVQDKRSDKERKEREHDSRRLAEIEKNVTEAKEQQAESQQLKGDADAWLNEVTVRIEKSLARLEKDYEFLRRQALQVEQTATLVYQQIVSQQVELAASGAGNNPFISGRFGQQRLLMEMRLTEYRAEYASLYQQAFQVADQARGLLQQKHAAIRQYEKVTGQVVRKSDDLKKWQARLEQTQKQVDKKNAEEKKRKRQSRGENRLRSIRTFVPLDPDAESRRVLNWFGSVASKGDKL